MGIFLIRDGKMSIITPCHDTCAPLIQQENLDLIKQLQQENLLLKSQLNKFLEHELNNKCREIIDKELKYDPNFESELGKIPDFGSGSKYRDEYMKEYWYIIGLHNKSYYNREALANSNQPTTLNLVTHPLNIVSQFYGYCFCCESPVPIRVVARCYKCNKSVNIDKKGRWTLTDGEFVGCAHDNIDSKTEDKINDNSKVDNKANNTSWEFVKTCLIDARHTDCLLLPGVELNTQGLQCDGCRKVESLIIRFDDCGHFICWRQCWGRYAAVKLDHRELIFLNDSVNNGILDPTLSCPAGCDSFIKSKNLFRALGPKRFDQYNIQRLEKKAGKEPNRKSKLGYLPLTKRLL